MQSDFNSVDWDSIDFVIFDVDGTLYNQRRLRMYMARDLIRHTVFQGDLKTIRVLKVYRQIRERLAEAETANFEQILVAETSRITNCPADRVKEIVSEWLERRPLTYLHKCIYRGIGNLFHALVRKNKIIGIISDYPADTKLSVMGLMADYIVSANDPNIGFLKPNTRGLECLMRMGKIETDHILLIGDREDRDGLAAQRLNIRTLIRSDKHISGWQSFRDYEDEIFFPLFID
jgi:FMN phosphatase YigB (HAD superfamily)